MQEYDLYLNPQKPAVGLYVHKGASLPDLADLKEWIFDGTAAQVEIAGRACEANRHERSRLSRHGLIQTRIKHG